MADAFLWTRADKRCIAAETRIKQEATQSYVNFAVAANVVQLR
jgi:hypothetical protein